MDIQSLPFGAHGVRFTLNMLRSMNRWYDRFLFEGCDPKLVSAFRIGYALLLFVYVATWSHGYSMWFTEQGVLGIKAASQFGTASSSSLLFHFTSSSFAALGLGLLTVHAVLLLLGVWSRLQAGCIFIWLVSFQHRNPLICDGEDTVFRLFALFMTLMPLDAYWSLTRKRGLTPLAQAPFSQAWGMRLVQIQMTMIYLSAGISKLAGSSWWDGSAMFRVSRMENYGGRDWLPMFWTETPWMLQWATWLGLAIELSLPVLLWLKPTRRLAIVLGILFHLAIESILNLFLFEWIMILGLLTFLDRFPKWDCNCFQASPVPDKVPITSD